MSKEIEHFKKLLTTEVPPVKLGNKKQDRQMWNVRSKS